MVQLIHDYLDNEISAEDLQELESWMRESPENVQLFVRTSFVHRQLRDLSVGHLESVEPATDMTTCELPTSRRPGIKSVSRRFAGVAAALLLMSGVALGVYFKDQLPGTSPVGELVSMIDCRWISPQEPRSTKLYQGDGLHLASGRAELKFTNGSVVTLEGPAHLRIKSSDTIRLLSGKIFVEAKQDLQGLTVETPGTKSIDIGTRFGVEVTSDEITEVHVFEGIVQAGLVDPNNELEDQVRLLENDAVRLDPHSQTIERLIAQHHYFAESVHGRKPRYVYVPSGDGQVDIDASRRSADGPLATDQQFGVVAEYDLHIAEEKEYKLWMYGAGPESFSDSIRIELYRLSSDDTLIAEEDLLFCKTLVGASRGGDFWMGIAWQDEDIAQVLATGAYRIKVRSREVGRSVRQLRLQDASQPKPVSVQEGSE